MPEFDPYTYSADLQSSKDISEASMIISDLEMLCAFVGDKIFVPKFYRPLNDPSAMVASMDTVAKYYSIAFNQAMCVDGKKRNGSVFVNYGLSSPNVRFYHDFGFVGRVLLTNFEVNGWRVENLNSAPFTISNKVSPANYDPSVTNLSWEIMGQLKFTKVTDTTKKLTWNGKVIKTLINTNNPVVFNPNKNAAIQWPFAVVIYSGQANGITTSILPYSAKTDKPLKRDFNCNFMPPNNPNVTELHPFINGSLIFNCSNFHPRTINFGPDEPGLCDDQGVVSFSSESHDIVFE